MTRRKTESIANSVQLQLQLPTGTELGNKLINLLSTPVQAVAYFYCNI